MRWFEKIVSWAVLKKGTAYDKFKDPHSTSNRKCRNCGASLDYTDVKCGTCGRKTITFKGH